MCAAASDLLRSVLPSLLLEFGGGIREEFDSDIDLSFFCVCLWIIDFRALYYFAYFIKSLFPQNNLIVNFQKDVMVVKFKKKSKKAQPLYDILCIFGS